MSPVTRHAPVEPSSDEVRETLLGTEPQPPIPPRGDERWRSATNPPVWNEIDTLAQRALDDAPPVIRASHIVAFSSVGDRGVFQGPYHERRMQIVALAAVLCRDDALPASAERLAGELQDRLWQVCEETSWILSAHLWNNGLSSELPPPDIHAVDLGAAQTAFTLAEVVTLTADLLHPEIVERVDYEIEQRVLRPYLYRNNFHWLDAEHNWNIVCHAGIVGAALYRSPNRYAPAIVAKTLAHAPRFIDGYDDDGASPEGIMVWNLGFGHLCMLNDLLERWSDRELSLFDGRESKISSMAAFARNLHLVDNRYVNFSDAERSIDLTPFALDYANRRLGLELPVPPYRKLREHDSVLRTLFTPAPVDLVVEAHPRAVFYAGHQWMIARSDDSARPSMTLATKGGHNGESHNHNDLGSFVLHAAGDTLIAELGRDRFTRETFAGDRYAGLAYSSRGHSVPRLDGALQQPGERYRARVLEQSFGATDVVVYDLTAAYAPDPRLRRFVRRFELRRGERRLVVHDDFDLDGELPIEEVFWSFLPVDAAGGDAFSISGPTAATRASFEPAPQSVRVEEVANAVFGETAYVVVGSFTPGGRQRITTTFHIDIDPGWTT